MTDFEDAAALSAKIERWLRTVDRPFKTTDAIELGLGLPATHSLETIVGPMLRSFGCVRKRSRRWTPRARYWTVPPKPASQGRTEIPPETTPGKGA